MLKKMNKNAVSVMVSYAILISITIGLSIGIFVWLKAYANVTPLPECKPETSVILNDYECGIGRIKLDITNNGLFNVDGFILLVGEDSGKLPTETLQAISLGAYHTLGQGHFVFLSPLKPGKTEEVEFSTGASYKKDIQKIQIQALILSEKGDKIPCENAVISQTLDCPYPTLSP